MTTTLISPLPIQHFVDSNGNALTGGLLFTYVAGTTTKQTTFTDSTGNTANTNPVVLNSRGEANVWMAQGQTYKFVLAPSTDTDPPSNPIWTVDNLQPGGLAAIASGSILGNSSGSPAPATAQTVGSGLTLSGGSLTANFQTAGTGIALNTGTVSAILRGYISGLILSNDSGTPNTILDISAGECTDSTGAVAIALAAFTKTTGGVWVAGTGNAGMGTGLTIANNTWYHVFAIINNGAADVYFDTSVSAANAPASTTAFRRIGSFRTSAGGAILAFVQSNISPPTFTWSTPFQEFSGTITTTAAATITMSGIPTGLSVEAILSASVAPQGGSDTVLYLSNLANTDIAAQVGGGLSVEATGSANVGVGGLRVITNTSAQIRRRMGVTTADVVIMSTGWVDGRGVN